jgi:hypothetical protein
LLYFSDGVSCFLPGLALDHGPPNSASQGTGIIGIYYHTQPSMALF